MLRAASIYIASDLHAGEEGAMSFSSGSFRHTSKYSATASKYGPGGAPAKGSSVKGGAGGGGKPGLWDGFKKGETAVDRQQASSDPDGGRGGSEKDGLLEKDYIAEARQKSERLQACLTQVSSGISPAAVRLIYQTRK